MKETFMRFQNKTKGKINRLLVDPRSVVGAVEFDDDDGKPWVSVVLLTGGTLHLQDPLRDILERIENSRKDYIQDEEEPNDGE